MMDDLVKLITTVGFPIAVSSFLLYRLDTSLRELRDTVRELVHEMKRRRGAA